MRQLKRQKQDDWDQLIEHARARIDRARHEVVSMVEQCFQRMEDAVLTQFVKPSMETAFQRVQMPIKVV